MIFTSVSLPSGYSRVLRGLIKVLNLLESVLMCIHRKCPGFGLGSTHNHNVYYFNIPTVQVIFKTSMGQINFKSNKEIHSYSLKGKGCC